MHNIESKLPMVSGKFSISMKRPRPDKEISGSPERTDFRCVIESYDGGLFIIECFELSKSKRKQVIADTINRLNIHGLKKTIPYQKSEDGNFLFTENGLVWQVCRFIESDDIVRPDYVFLPEIGEEFADFIIDLNRISRKIDLNSTDLPFFSIKKYIISIFTQINTHNPEIIPKIKPVYDFLENNFFDKHCLLKEGFCHGDIHPMNAIWKNNKIIAVIDWEFMGIKPEIYDLANLLGCIGIEDPNALGGDLVKELIGKLKKSDIYGNDSWDILIEFVIAVRFGWLSEWLRKKDTEMIQLETDFMNLLLNYSKDIKSHWNTIRGEN